MDLQLTNVINIQVSQPGAGVGAYNTSNLAIFTDEQPGVGFGVLGYKIYLEPTEVAEDFGTDSDTFAQAIAIFSQTPNILANQGYLVIIPMINELQDFALDGVPASGTFVLNYLGNPSAAINWDDTAAEIQDILRAVEGLEQVVVSGSLASQDFKVQLWGVYGDAAALTVSANSLMTSAPAAIAITVSEDVVGETFAEAITRTSDLVQYFGLFATSILPDADVLAAAAIIEALNKIALYVFSDPLSVAPGGIADDLRSGGFDQNRALFYGGTETSPLVMMASYAGRAFSTNFEGSNTTQTMHLKDLTGVLPDDSMTQTLLNQCKDAGADVYISLQGIPKVFTSGGNDFFDNVYNLQWFVGALQVAGFNLLAQSSTKIPQTESGMDALKNAYRQVCEQAVTNQFSAPGAWNSPTFFGDQADLLSNVSQRGYYIFSQPVSLQSPVARAARQAPLIQIALKYAGAIHSSTVIVNVNP